MILKADEDWGRRDLNQLTLSELCELKDEVDKTADRVKGQIKDAKYRFRATGKAADPDWLSRAETFSRIMNRKRQMLQDYIAQRRRAAEQKENEERERQFERCFVTCAKEQLSEETYRDLIAAAHERQRQNGHAEIEAVNVETSHHYRSEAGL